MHWALCEQSLVDLSALCLGSRLSRLTRSLPGSCPFTLNGLWEWGLNTQESSIKGPARPPLFTPAHCNRTCRAVLYKIIIIARQLHMYIQCTVVIFPNHWLWWQSPFLSECFLLSSLLLAFPLKKMIPTPPHSMQWWSMNRSWGTDLTSYFLKGSMLSRYRSESCCESRWLCCVSVTCGILFALSDLGTLKLPPSYHKALWHFSVCHWYTVSKVHVSSTAVLLWRRPEVRPRSCTVGRRLRMLPCFPKSEVKGCEGSRKLWFLVIYPR